MNQRALIASAATALLSTMLLSTSAMAASHAAAPKAEKEKCYGIAKAGMEAMAYTLAKEEREHGIRVAVLKEGSPSCGSTYSYDGSFSGARVPAPGVTTARLMAAGTIEVAPLAYMRGRTLNDAFIILDEAQNTSAEQMKMFLTRLGFGSKMVVTGDVTQVDLPSGTTSGLRVVQEILDGIDDVRFHLLTSADVVRHRLVSEIVDAYGRWDEARLAPAVTARREASSRRNRR